MVRQILGTYSMITKPCYLVIVFPHTFTRLSRDTGAVISNHKFIGDGFLGTQVVNLNNPDCNKELEDRNVFWTSTFSSGTVNLIFLDCPCKY